MNLIASQLYLSITEDITSYNLYHIRSFIARAINEEYIGVFVCQQGDCRIILDSQSYVIKKNDICLYRPHQALQIQERSQDLKGIMLATPPEKIRHTFTAVRSAESMMYIRTHPCITIPDVQFPIIEHLIQALTQKLESLGKQEVEENSIDGKILHSIADAFIFEILNVYSASQPVLPQKQDRQEIILQKFIFSLFSHYREQRDVLYYANEQCLSPRYFSTVIKSASGKSALQWISDIVINEMKKKLIESDDSIKEVAYYFNFPSQSFFGKYFKLYTGFSPKEFRKQNEETK